MDRDEAEAALAAMQQAQDKLAAIADYPPWRHAAAAAVLAVLVFSVSLTSPFSTALLALSMAALAWIVHSDKVRYGLFVSGWQRGPTLPLTIALLLVSWALMAVSLTVRGDPFPAPQAIFAALAAFVLCWIGSVIWQRIYLRELRKGSRQ